MAGWVKRMRQRWRGHVSGHAPGMAAAPDADSPARAHGGEAAFADDEPDLDVVVCAEEQAAFMATLQAQTGRDCAQWMTFLGAMQATATRNGIIDLLRRQGFDWRWASVLERLFAATPHACYGLLPRAPAPAVAVDPPTAHGLASAYAAADSPRAGEPRLLYRNADEHAQALVRWLWAAGMSGRVWARDVTAAYEDMCRAHRWLPHNWNQTGAHFRQLVLSGGGESRYGNLRDIDGGKHRVLYYRLPEARGEPAASAEPARAAA